MAGIFELPPEEVNPATIGDLLNTAPALSSEVRRRYALNFREGLGEGYSIYRVKNSANWIIGKPTQYESGFKLTTWFLFSGMADVFNLQDKASTILLRWRFPEVFVAEFNALTEDGEVEVKKYLRYRNILLLNPKDIVISSANEDKTRMLHLSPYLSRRGGASPSNVLLYLSNETWGLHFLNVVLSPPNPFVLLHELSHHRRNVIMWEKARNVGCSSKLEYVAARGETYRRLPAVEERYTEAFVLYLFRKLGIPPEQLLNLFKEYIEPVLRFFDKEKGLIDPWGRVNTRRLDPNVPLYNYASQTVRRAARRIRIVSV